MANTQLQSIHIDFIPMVVHMVSLRAYQKWGFDWQAVAHAKEQECASLHGTIGELERGRADIHAQLDMQQRVISTQRELIRSLEEDLKHVRGENHASPSEFELGMNIALQQPRLQSPAFELKRGESEMNSDSPLMELANTAGAMSEKHNLEIEAESQCKRIEFEGGWAASK